MARAYKCDQCGEFEEGEPAIKLNVSLQVGEPGVFEAVFGGASGPGESLELCGLDCLQAIDLDDRKDELLADVDQKDRLFDDPHPDPGLESDTPTIE